jgi:hypothetical protein
MQRLLRRKKGKLSLETKLKMSLATAAGMAHLHEEKILHNVRTHLLLLISLVSPPTTSFGFRILRLAICW